MAAKYAEIFIDAWNGVMSPFPCGHIAGADVFSSSRGVRSRDICVLMKPVGAVDGRIFLTTDAATGKKPVSKMLGGRRIGLPREDSGTELVVFPM